VTGIDGVVAKALVTHPDERGFFRELIRVSDGFFGEGFGQLSHSYMHAGVVKAWHYHPHQVDWWYVIGCLRVALYDLREESPTRGRLEQLVMGGAHQPVVLRIPPMVAHGCRALEASHLIYVTSSVYDTGEEGRLPHNDPAIGFDWLAAPPIS
jgi:dTDP-4-dehydrorhamnose 3,5-epimerase